MYNRYIPQSDGTYRRNRMQEPASKRQPRPAPPPQQPKETHCPPPQPEPPREQQECPRRKSQPQQHIRMDGFLQQLLPRDFDTGDLIVVLLLLLMAGDSEEGRNNALLTLALYFLM